ncbi:uncharacterized protein [Euwallacea fornicatus]|uniref:uncharacterized protein isoform X2 n=1 Tax=Euwallacea fornicatus TaxID=995702 RepID=UPI00338D5FC6
MLIYSLSSKEMVIPILSLLILNSASDRLSCYQCKRYDDEECEARDLKPCGEPYDRCAIHITKQAKELVVKRECGLAPCNFEDENMAKGLGMNCDKTKDSYSCTSCCKISGCNRNSAGAKVVLKSLLIVAVVIACVLNMFRDFIPPYVQQENFSRNKI